MGIRPLPRSNPSNGEVSKLESNVANAWESIVKHPLLQNLQFIKNISVSSSDTIINHGLNHAVNGWIVVKKNANITVYESSTTNPAPTANIILKASGSGTISVLFF